MKNKGFTLIELLVVIAIIGILSGTVIVSMSGAQNSAKNARIKADMDQLRATAEIYRLSNGSAGYGVTDGPSFLSVATSDGGLLVKDIGDANGTFVKFIAADKYCISSSLNGGGIHCLDSTGRVGTSACAATFDCP